VPEEQTDDPVSLSQISFVGLVALDEILAAVGERPGSSPSPRRVFSLS
jgi:hypothetical protein